MPAVSGGIFLRLLSDGLGRAEILGAPHGFLYRR